jgi:sialate O-acetylesterase
VGNFKLHILQPTITDWDNYVTKVISVGGDWKPVTVLFSEVKQAGWGKRLPFTQDQLAGLMIEQLISETAPARPPGGLFNGMIAPVVSFPIRGAIWYQGEGNAGRAFQYRSLLPSMISSWREAWGQGDFPFLVVQLPNFKRRQSEPSESAWAELREAQLKTLAVPKVGLAVSIDAGEADDVHPKNKRKIGERLALWALGTTYEKKLTFSGPLFREMVKEGDRLRLRFDHRGKGLVSDGGGPLRGFAVAGEDREFHWAEAKIEKGSVVVWSSEVPEPLAVRYAWADNPDCNLYNKAGLPASPFRTDDWPGVTFEQR